MCVYIAILYSLFEPGYGECPAVIVAYLNSRYAWAQGGSTAAPAISGRYSVESNTFKLQLYACNFLHTYTEDLSMAFHRCDLIC
jgi:hypothetical protein